eukprot:gene8787-14247_t
MGDDSDDLPITEELVKLVTGQFDLGSVLTLPLCGLGRPPVIKLHFRSGTARSSRPPPPDAAAPAAAAHSAAPAAGTAPAPPPPGVAPTSPMSPRAAAAHHSLDLASRLAGVPTGNVMVMLKRGRAPKHCPWGIELDASMKFTRCTLQSVAQGDDEMRACVGMTLTTINGQVPGADSTHPNSTTTGPGDANQTVACAADLVPSATSQDEKLVQKQAKAAPKDTGRKAQKLKAAEGSG